MAQRPQPTHPALRLALRLPRQGIMPRPSCQGHHARHVAGPATRLAPGNRPVRFRKRRPPRDRSAPLRACAGAVHGLGTISNERVKIESSSTVFAVGENHNFCCDISHNAKLKPTEKDKGCTQLQQRHRKSTWTGTPPACGRGWSEHTAAATFTSWSSSPTRRPLGNLSILGHPRR